MKTYTIPFISSNPGIYVAIRNRWRDLTMTYLNNSLHLTGQCSVDFQPLPSIIGQHSEANGGNAMGLSGSDPNRLLLELQCEWPSATDDAELYSISRQMTDWLDQQVPIWLAAANRENEYLPLFMNDAQADQNVTGSYRGYPEFRALQLQLDPQGLFRERAGGFKY